MDNGFVDAAAASRHWRNDKSRRKGYAMWSEAGRSVGASPQQDAWLYIDEITHRTINDYTIILAMLKRAERVTTDPVSACALRDISEKLRGVATAYRSLRPPGKQGMVQVDIELERVCAAFSASVLADRSIGLTLFCDSFEMDANRCWKICLIISELLINTARHAFADRNDGAVIVDVRCMETTLCCAVSDNGVANETAKPGRGAAIIDSLAADLGGVVTRNHTRTGSTIVLSIPRCASAQCAPEAGMA